MCLLFITSTAHYGFGLKFLLNRSTGNHVTGNSDYGLTCYLHSLEARGSCLSVMFTVMY